MKNKTEHLGLERVLLEGIEEMVFIVKKCGDSWVYEFINDAVKANTKIRDCALGKTFHEVHSPKMAELLIGYYEKVVADRTSVFYEDSYIAPNGGLRYSKSRLTPMFDDSGHLSRVVSVVNDITEEKLAKQALNSLEKSNAKYRSFFESNDDAVLTLTLDGKIVDGNQTARALVRSPIGEWAGDDFCFLVEQQDQLRAKEIFAEAVSGTCKDHRLYLANQNGESISCLVKFIPIVVHQQTTGFYLMAKDMTELDILVSKYLENEQNFRIIAENVYDVIVLMDWQQQYIYVSPSSRQIFGLPPEQVIGQQPFFNVHPEDLPFLEKQFQKSVQKARPYSMQLRIDHQSRGWIWTELNGAPVYDEQNVFSHMVMIVRDISVQKQYEEQLEFYAFHDSLTGLPNRRYFQEYSSLKLKERAEAKEKFALAVLDLDDFKIINDEFGHDSGDMVLQSFAERLSALDKGKFMSARMGGDEFVVLLEKVQSLAEAQEAAKQIHAVLHGGWTIKDVRVDVNFSLGVAVACAMEESVSSILKRADEAMYKAKGSEQNKFEIFQP